MHAINFTFSWIDHSMDVVYGAIPVDVHVGGMIGREAETAQGAALIKV